MKKSKFMESQITAAVKSYEAGKDVNQICRELKINRATLYNWKKKYAMAPNLLPPNKSVLFK